MNNKNIKIIIISLILIFIIIKNPNNEKFINNKEYLLFSSVGKRLKSGIPFWTKSENRNYDIVLYYYNLDKPKNCSDYCINRKGSKFRNFYHFFKNNNLSKYKVIWIVDDDIQIETKNINKLFDIFVKYNLDIAQPSFDSESYISHSITKNQEGNILRFTNFVEVGVFMFSYKAIEINIEAFNKTDTGFYLDYLVCKTIDKGRNIAIIDKITCHHPKQPRVIEKNFLNIPKMISEGNILLDDYDIRPSSHIEYAKITDTKYYLNIKKNKNNNYKNNNTNYYIIILLCIFIFIFFK